MFFPFPWTSEVSEWHWQNVTGVHSPSLYDLKHIKDPCCSPQRLTAWDSWGKERLGKLICHGVPNLMSQRPFIQERCLFEVSVIKSYHKTNTRLKISRANARKQAHSCEAWLMMRHGLWPSLSHFRVVHTHVPRQGSHLKLPPGLFLLRLALLSWPLRLPDGEWFIIKC